MTKRIAVVGTFDSKGAEHAFLRSQLIDLGAEVLTINVGTLGSTEQFPVDVEANEIATAAGSSIEQLRAAGDRGAAMEVMSRGAETVIKDLFDAGRLDAVVGMGGSGGTTIITSAMRALPVGVPKVCVSTLAGANAGPYVGSKDVTLIPAVTDVAGVNRISRGIYTRAAGAVWGMLQARVPVTNGDERPLLAASMFGNTTECVDACREALEKAGHEVLVFHATGTGGRTMEGLIDDGFVDACLDITTTEWADEVCEGILSAGPTRLDAAGKAGIPHLIVPGCVDMANFGGMETVPQRFKDQNRLFHCWNPTVTLMRTNREENQRMGEVFAAKANAAQGPVRFLFPNKGLSILGGSGQEFHDPDADQALLAAIRKDLNPDIQLIEVDANINDAEFAALAVKHMLDLIALHANKAE